MTNSRRSKTESEDCPDLLPQSSPLDPWRAALSSLSDAVEKADTLRQVASALKADAEGNASLREELLSQSVEVADEESTVTELSRLRSRGELYERKIGDVEGRIADAEKDLAAQLATVCVRLGSLYRSFYQWNFEQQKRVIAAMLVPAGGTALVEQAAWNSKALAAVRELEITASELGGVVESGHKLLEAVSRSGWSELPAYTPETPTEPLEADPPYPPRADMGIDVPAELEKLRARDPAITLRGALRELYRMCPEIFVPVGNPNEPLPIPETGIWQTEMIGSTTTDTKEPSYA